MTFKNIIATDFAEASQRARHFARALAQKFATPAHGRETPSYSYGGSLYLPVAARTAEVPVLTNRGALVAK